MALPLAVAISKFGKSAKAKLQNPTASGEPRDPLRLQAELSTRSARGRHPSLPKAHRRELSAHRAGHVPELAVGRQ